MSPMPSGRGDRFTASQQVKRRLSVANHPTEPPHIPLVADVIPMKRDRDTGRNIGYEVPPAPLRVPYGWRLMRVDEGYLLVHDGETWPVIERIVSMRRSGRKYEEITQTLIDEAVPAPRDPHSSHRWHDERVRQLVIRYAPDVAKRPVVRGVGPAGPMPDSPELDDEFDKMDRRARELGFVDDDED